MYYMMLNVSPLNLILFPEEPNDEEEWIQFDLGMTRSIYGVVTKGRADYQQWVTSYKVQYSAGNATDFMPVTDVVGDEEVRGKTL